MNQQNFIWKRFLNDDIAPKNGLYVFACAGDNHILFEIYRLEKGERLWKHFEDDFEHNNGWTVVIPEAYHYLPEYDSISTEWASCDSLFINRGQIRIIACSIKDKIGYLLAEGNSIIGSCGDFLLDDVSEDSFLAFRFIPLYLDVL